MKESARNEQPVDGIVGRLRTVNVPTFDGRVPRLAAFVDMGVELCMCPEACESCSVSPGVPKVIFLISSIILCTQPSELIALALGCWPDVLGIACWLMLIM